MANLVELELGDGRVVLVEADDEVSMPRSTMAYRRAARDVEQRARFDAVTETLRGFTDRAVQALRSVDADIERVTLQFGLSLGGDAGIPFVTKDSDGGTLKVTVECNLGQRGERLSLDDQ